MPHIPEAADVLSSLLSVTASDSFCLTTDFMGLLVLRVDKVSITSPETTPLLLEVGVYF